MSEQPWYGGGLSKEPKVFTAINHIDFHHSSTANLRMFASYKWTDRLRWVVGREQTPIYQTGFCWMQSSNFTNLMSGTCINRVQLIWSDV